MITPPPCLMSNVQELSRKRCGPQLCDTRCLDRGRCMIMMYIINAMMYIINTMMHIINAMMHIIKIIVIVINITIMILISS